MWQYRPSTPYNQSRPLQYLWKEAQPIHLYEINRDLPALPAAERSAQRWSSKCLVLWDKWGGGRDLGFTCCLSGTG